MRTLSGELGAWIDRAKPRVYVDANVPLGLIGFMRLQLEWDVFSVMEHPDLRRARDVEHYRLARRMLRTLITLDRDFFDDKQFPPADSSGVIVLSAPDERQLARVLRTLDRTLRGRDRGPAPLMPLAGRKLLAEPSLPATVRRTRRRRRQ